jgi:hypothetical protein
MQEMKTNASRCCVFCGSPADSKEHVFAKRLCSRARTEKYPVIAGLSVEGQENITRNEHQIEAVQVRHVCKNCNNTWMNDLEAWFELRLGFLIEPQWPQLALPMIEALKLERDKLAQWLIKTAVTFSLASVQGEHPVEFSPTVTRKIKDGILPENCWIDLAYSKTVLTAIGGMTTRTFYVINAKQPIQSQVIKNGDGFKFIVQFNHLLLRIAQAPGANVMYQSHQGEIPVRLYPTPSPQTPDNFAYEDIMNFERSVVLETWKGCRGNIT